LQYLITGRVTVTVVYGFEVVDIQHDAREFMVVSLR
jgi:hypothetical protein